MPPRLEAIVAIDAPAGSDDTVEVASVGTATDTTVDVASADTATARTVTATPHHESQPERPARSNLVLAVQRALSERGYDPGPIDGIAGPMTRTAVLHYQRRAGVAPDGVIDRPLLQSLGTDAPRPVRVASTDDSSTHSDAVLPGFQKSVRAFSDALTALFGFEPDHGR